MKTTMAAPRIVWALAFVLATPAVALLAACSSPAASISTRPVVRIVRDAVLGRALAHELSRRLPGLEFRFVEAEGSIGTLRALQEEAADIGFMLGDVAYFSYIGDVQRTPFAVQPLRGVAALGAVPIHLLVKPGLPIQNISELRGYRVGAGTALLGQTHLANLLFRVFHLGVEVMQTGPRSDLLAGVDAAIRTTYYPAPNVRAAALMGARLVSIDGPIVDDLQAAYPFLKRLTIPADTYPNQPDPISTIGVDRLLVCRADLDEAIVHDVTQHFLEALPALAAAAASSVRLTELELTPATTIPLHGGAALYYRERELSQ